MTPTLNVPIEDPAEQAGPYFHTFKSVARPANPTPNPGLHLVLALLLLLDRELALTLSLDGSSERLGQRGVSSAGSRL